MIPKRAARRIDPDNVRPLICEHHCDHRTGQILAEIQQPDSFKRTHDGSPFRQISAMRAQAQHCCDDHRLRK
jgi:hypothetical protein